MGGAGFFLSLGLFKNLIMQEGNGGAHTITKCLSFSKTAEIVIFLTLGVMAKNGVGAENLGEKCVYTVLEQPLTSTSVCVCHA